MRDQKISGEILAQPTWRRRHLGALLLIIIAVIAMPVVTSGESQDAKAAYEKLRSMTLEELLDTKVTSVSRAPEKLVDTASAIQVISADDIRRSGATVLPDALRLANNLNVAQKNSHDWAISARGFNTDLSNKLLVMVDGRSIYTPLFSGVRWDVQDYLLEDLDRIEVISGPGGSVWGANAVNGVINIISKSAEETQGAYVEAFSGNESNRGYAARYGGSLESNVHYRVYAKRLERADQEYKDGTSANDAGHLNQGGFRIDASLKNGNAVTVQGDLYQGDEGFLTGGTAVLSGGNLLSRWTRSIASGSETQVQVYFDRANVEQPVSTTFAPRGTFHDSLDTWDLDFQQRMVPTLLQQLVWGVGYRHINDRSTSAPGLAFEPPHLRQDLFSGFVQGDVELRERVVATLGSKIEHNDYTGWELEPSARLTWQPAPRHTIWGSVSRAVRTPSRVDRDIRQPATSPIILQGGAHFSSEKVIAYELGYRAQATERISFSASTFLNDYWDVRSVASTPVTQLPFTFANDLEGRTYGCELTADIQVMSRWRLHAAYTRMAETIKVRAGASDLNNALNETADPGRQVLLRSSVDLPKNVEFDADFRWVDSLQLNANGTPGFVPSYGELDLRLAWRPIPSLEFSVVGQNLLHARHPEYAPASPTRVEIHRSVYAKAAWRF